MTGPRPDPLDDYTPADPLADYAPASGVGPWLRREAGAAKRVLGAEYELGRGAVNTLFGGIVGAPVQALRTVLAPQTPAEESNPIARGYEAAKVGLPPTEPSGNAPAAPSPGPAAQAVALAKGLIPNPIGHIQQAIAAPDWFSRGEALGAVPLDIGMIYGGTRLASGAASGLASRMRPIGGPVEAASVGEPSPAHREGPTATGPDPMADYHEPTPARPETAPATQAAAPPGDPLADYREPTLGTRGQLAGEIRPDFEARLREYVDAAFAEPKTFGVPASVTLALRNNDNLGFETRGGAANAILQHDDWAQRWQVPEPERAALEVWRQATLAHLGANEGTVVGAIEPTPGPAATPPKVTTAPIAPEAKPAALPKNIAKWPDDALQQAYLKSIDSLAGRGLEGLWTRYDDDIGEQRSASGGGLSGYMVQQTQAYIGKLEAELTRRGYDSDHLDRLYRDHADQQAAPSGAARDPMADYNEDLGWSLPLPRGKAPKPTEATLFGEPQTNLLGETTAPTMAESAVGQRTEGAPVGMTEALTRARATVADPKELYLARQGQPSTAYTEAQALLRSSEKLGAGGAPDQPPPGDLFASRALPAQASTRLPPPTEAGAPGAPEAPPAGASSIPASLADDFRKVFAPDIRSPEAARAADIIARHAGEEARRIAIDQASLAQARKLVPTFSSGAGVDFAQRMENGEPQPGPELQQAADATRRVLDAKTQLVQAQGTGALQHAITDYFGRIWKQPGEDQGAIARILGRRPLQGPKGFLKERSIPTFREGIERGLVPVSDNPVDLQGLKAREMDRYVKGVRIKQDFINEGLAKYVPVSDKPPAGMVKLDDPAFTVYGKPTVSVSESYDPVLREQLEQVLKRVGGTHERLTSLPGAKPGALGEAQGQAVRTRFGTDVTVLEHELGHALDSRFGFRAALLDSENPAERAQVARELGNLAALRHEGTTPKPSYAAYVQQPEEQVANAVHALLYTPERMAEVAPHVKESLEALLASHPETAPLLRLQKSLVAAKGTAEVPVGGMVVRGHYYATEPVARVANNYTSPGLEESWAGRTYMAASNRLNQAQLAGPFHATFTSINAVLSKAALAGYDIRAGHPLRAIGRLGEAVAAPITDAFRGGRIGKEYRNPGQFPEYAEAAAQLARGGGRGQMDNAFRTRSLQALGDAWRGGELGKAAFRLPGAALELQAKPIMEKFVPAVKRAAFEDLARVEVERLGPNPSPALVDATLRRVNDAIDNRFGQLTYDNLFWKRTTKLLGQGGLRAPGWLVGTVRIVGSGGADLLRGRLTPNASYLVALAGGTMVMNGMIQYLLAGKPPASLTDLVHPRTGRLDPDGNEERLSLPTYMARDVSSFVRHPIDYAVNKASPVINLAHEVGTNRDFYGNEIVNPHDALPTELGQAGRYALSQVTPFSVRNAQQQGQNNQGPLLKALAALGVQAAPREVVRSPAQNLMADLLRTHGTGGATPEQLEARARRLAIARGIRQGTISPSAVIDSMRAGAITWPQARTLERTKNEPPMVGAFRHLGWADAEKVFAKANPQEERYWAPLLYEKRLKALDALQATGVENDQTRSLAQSLRGGPRSMAPAGAP